MALPAFTKTYEFVVNQTFGGGVDYRADHAEGLLLLKDTLISGSFTSTWSVAGSCDSTFSGMDGIDRWIDPSKLVWKEFATQPRSWIVLNTGGGGQLLIECLGNGSGIGPTLLRTKWSVSGSFSGGSTIATPTATDEQTLLNTEFWLAGQNSVQTYKLHVIRSTDGETTLVFGCHANSVPLFFSLTRIQNVVAGLNHHWGIVWPPGGAGVDGASYANLLDAQKFVLHTALGGSAFNCAWSTEVFASNAVGQTIPAPNDFTGKWQA